MLWSQPGRRVTRNMRATSILRARICCRLINDLLDVAKIEAGKMDIDPNPLEVRKTLESALKIMAPKRARSARSLSSTWSRNRRRSTPTSARSSRS